jgi:hypothetical protein
MKTILLIILLSTSVFAQNKVSILGGVSYAPRFDNASINKQTLTPSFNAVIGDSITALNLCFGNVLKCGIIARKGVFRIGVNYCVDLLSNETPRQYAEIELGVMFDIGNDKSTTICLTTIASVILKDNDFSFVPLNIGVYKSLIK